MAKNNILSINFIKIFNYNKKNKIWIPIKPKTQKPISSKHKQTHFWKMLIALSLHLICIIWARCALIMFFLWSKPGRFKGILKVIVKEFNWHLKNKKWSNSVYKSIIRPWKLCKTRSKMRIKVWWAMNEWGIGVEKWDSWQVWKVCWVSTAIGQSSQ